MKVCRNMLQIHTGLHICILMYVYVSLLKGGIIIAVNDIVRKRTHEVTFEDNPFGYIRTNCYCAKRRKVLTSYKMCLSLVFLSIFPVHSCCKKRNTADINTRKLNCQLFVV